MAGVGGALYLSVAEELGQDPHLVPFDDVFQFSKQFRFYVRT